MSCVFIINFKNLQRTIISSMHSQIGDCFPPQFWLPNFSKGSPFGIYLRHSFFVNNLKIFLKANKTIFEGGARAEKSDFFWSKFFRKMPKKPFRPVLKHLPAAKKNFHKIQLLYFYRKARKIKLVDLKKKLTKLFEKTAALEKFLRTPLMKQLMMHKNSNTLI